MNVDTNETPLVYLPVIWITNFGLGVIGSITPNAVSEWIQVFNAAVLTVGSTAILLYQRRQTVVREERHKDELVARESALASLEETKEELNNKVRQLNAVEKELAVIKTELRQVQESSQ